MPSERRTILVVDDDVDTRQLFSAVLEEAGFRVLSVGSVSEALRVLRMGDRVDVVLADYSLEDGTGAELIHQATNEGHLDLRNTPALICTAYRYVELPPHVAIVHKPIDRDELLREIHDALARKDRAGPFAASDARAPSGIVDG